MQKPDSLQLRLIALLRVGIFAVIILMPFYAFLTTWISSYTGGLLLLRAWKEAVLGVLAVAALLLVARDKKLQKSLFKDRLVWAVMLFALWTLLVTGLLFTDLDANLLGAAMQLRPLLFFAVAAALSFYIKTSEQTLVRLVTVPAVGVVVFGLLQMFMLPYDFLKHFGYQKGVTIAPYFTIDDQLNRIRISSFLRGPNPLGVYLIAPIMAVVGGWRHIRQAHRKKAARSHLPSTIYRLLLAFCFLLPTLTVLYGTHSRSAWLGLLVGIGVYLWLLASKKAKVVLVMVGLVVGLGGGLLVYTYRSADFVQDIVLHDNPEEGGEISSNQGRIDAFKESAHDVAQSPIWGCGAGCAGPASVHNNAGAKISENFYIQTVQELGVVGLLMLGFVHALVIARLLSLRTAFSRAWIAVFAGISVASILSHAWADDTATYLWWGVAGLLVYNLRHKAKRYEKTTQTKTS